MELSLKQAVQNVDAAVAAWEGNREKRMILEQSWRMVAAKALPELAEKPATPAPEPEAPEAPDPEQGAPECADEAGGDDAEKT